LLGEIGQSLLPDDASIAHEVLARISAAEVPEAVNWTVSVFNIAGQLVRRFEGSTGGAGVVDLAWGGLNNNGRQVFTERMPAESVLSRKWCF
jgi:hypothetical protein